MGRYKNSKDTVEMIPTRASKWPDRSSGGSNTNGGRGSRSRIPASKSDGDYHERNERMDQHIEENRSFHSSSTDSTRPMVHSKRSSPSNYTHSWSTEEGKDQRRSPRNPRPGRQRVPGGAAAKLMLRGPKPSRSIEEIEPASDNTSSDDEPVDTSEIYDMMDKTKEEFEKGPQKSRFTAHAELPDQEIEISFVPAPEEETTDVLSADELEERLPYILNRSEAYHESASAAVAALLNPTKGGGDTGSVISGLSDLQSINSKTGSPRMPHTAPVSAFQRPHFEDIPTAGSGADSFGEEYDGIHKCPTTEPLITGETEERLDQMSKRMSDPSKQLSDLLKAIASPEDVTQVDRAYMVRRKNACGALQVLTAHARRRKQICWTVGVLPALTSVLQDAGEGRLDVAYPDERVRMEYEETRKRAIATLMNLSMPVSNRLAVFHAPGLVQALIYIINEDKGECLEGCCAVLAYLAKSVENRILMAQVPVLFETLIKVLRPQNDASLGLPEKKLVYPWISNDSDVDASSVSSEDSDLSETTAEGESSEGETSGMDTPDDDGNSTGGNSSASEGSHDSRSSGSTEGKETPIKNISMNQKPKTGQPKKKLVCSYDADKHLFAARQNIFALLGHLVKEKDNAYRLVRVNDLVLVVVAIATLQESPMHALAVQFLAHLTRHRLNNKILVIKMKVVVPAIVNATYSENEIARRSACFAIQNFSHDKSCRQELASSDKLINAICRVARVSKDSEEKLAAISALKNLSDEPANLIPLSNTPECIATLMQIAHGQEPGVTEMMQFRACDALATISHWLRKIATNGQNMDAARHGGPKPVGMFVPSLKVVGWTQFE